MPEEQEACLFCLEENTLQNRVICLNIDKRYELPCTCRIHTHVECWMAYFIKKGGFECPICHKKIVSRPEQQIAITSRNAVYHITLPTDATDTIQINLPTVRAVPQTRCGAASRVVTFSLCLLLFAGIAVIAGTHL
jgi:hypothetical protein